MGSTILEDDVICLSGTFPPYKHNDLKDLVKQHGGSFSLRLLGSCTHLITTQEDMDGGSTKYKQSLKFPNVKLVNVDWLLDSTEKQQRLDESSYILTPSSGAPAAAAAAVDATPAPAQQTRATRGKRALASQVDGDKNDAAEDKPPAKKAKESTKKAPTKQKDAPLVKKEDTPEPVGSGPKKWKVPIDAVKYQNMGYQVHIDDDGVIYDAALNQTNSSNNNNKFYIAQLLKGSSGFLTWTRWGRVGEHGQDATLSSGSFDSALKAFMKKFKDKSGLSWDNRHDDPKKGKYTYIERNYEEDEDDKPKKAKKKNEDGTIEEVELKMTKCTLSDPVQRLVGLIFNQQHWQSTMAAMDYDANKLPLGKLSKRTLQSGFQLLKDLSELVNDRDSYIAANGGSFSHWAELLSNQYFTVIPHAFGRQRPPVLSTVQQIKREIELLETLTDMEIANEIMLDANAAELDEVHPLDRQFQGLNLREMTALDHKSAEFTELENYLVKTCGQTHHIQYKLQEIFRVDREGENDRFAKSPYANLQNSNRRLLWHGSRTTNYGGILSQGLRIAPPEAPATGYMFGKGVYFADMSSKSANYCCSSYSNNLGILMLCDVELGDPMLELTNSEYNAGEHAKKQGKLATLGKGRAIPSVWKNAGCVNPDLKGVLMPDTTVAPKKEDGVYLQYNEYIVYDVAQIRVKYLLLVHM